MRNRSTEPLECRCLLSAVVEQIADFNQNPAGILGYVQSEQLNEKVVVFTMSTSADGDELWRSDGTATGTFRLTNGAAGPGGAHPHDLIRVGSCVFFTMTVDLHGELWRTDGSVSGTQRVAAFAGNFSQIVATDDAIAYVIKDGELWQTNGTAAGTNKIDVLLQPGSFIRNIRVSEGNSGADSLFLEAYSWLNGESFDQLLHYDLDFRKSTVLLSRDWTDRPLELFDVHQGRLLFSNSDSIHGTELWYSDGTPESTAIWMDINPGTASSNPSNVYLVGQNVYFSATSVEYGEELWFVRDHDSLPQVLDIAEGKESSSPSGITWSDGLYVVTSSGLRRISQSQFESLPEDPLRTTSMFHSLDSVAASTSLEAL